MAWIPETDRDDPFAVNLTGPTGDRLSVRFFGPVPGYDGCTWAGSVKRTRDGDVEASFTFEDNGTAETIDLLATIEDTTELISGCSYYYDIRAVSGTAAPTTLVKGLLIPTEPITSLP